MGAKRIHLLLKSIERYPVRTNPVLSILATAFLTEFRNAA
jgi:hypothetical protein